MGQEDEFMRRFKIKSLKGTEFPFFIYEKKGFFFRPAKDNLSGAFTKFGDALIQIKNHVPGRVNVKGKFAYATKEDLKEFLNDKKTDPS
jgi:hypothetical protein